MSIRVMIRDWVRDGELFHLPPSLDSEPARRWLFYSQEIRDVLHGPWASENERKSAGHVRGALDAYVTGRKIMVRLPPSKKKYALLALLEDANEEVWEFRCREPNPQVRIFGRFAERDTFVALTTRTKRECHTTEHYFYTKENCKKRWRYFFPSYQPYKGEAPDDYVSNCVFIGA